MFSWICIALLLHASVALGESSCTGRCGDSADHSYTCQCNSLCVDYGDCCSDINSVCMSCSDRCHGDYDFSLPCQCNSECPYHGNCCPDYDTCSTTVVGGSCADRCGDNMDQKYSCQCNSQCADFGDCCADYDALCSSGGGNTGGGGTSCSASAVSNSEILVVSADLWELDVSRASSSDIVVNKQASTSDSSSQDNSPNPFFSYVNTDLLTTSSYKALLDLLDNYQPVQGNDEQFTSVEFAEQDAFLDYFVQTKIGDGLYQFLSAKGMAGCGDISDFKQLLKDIWFGLYSRKNGAQDTSGFEHVFVGEIKGSSVSGFHNWISIYLQEQEGNLNYYGYTGTMEPNMWGLHFEWLGYMKGLSGSLIGSSPEYDLAIFTLCHLTRPDSQCKVNLKDDDGNVVTRSIQTWTWANSTPAPGRKYVASAYFLL